MVSREIKFGCQEVSIASDPLDELSYITLVAPGFGVSKIRHSVLTGDTVFLRCQFGRNCEYVVM